MATAKVVYASMTGNTEICANTVSDRLEELGLSVEISECTHVEAEDLLDYDLLVIASYTYGDGDLPDEMVDLYEDLADLNLTGKVYGVCGSGDTFYDLFCKAVDAFDARLAMSGATKGSESVKINLAPGSDETARLEKFATELANKVQ